MVFSHVVCSLEHVTSTHEPGGFPGGSDRGHEASVPGLGISPGEGNGYPLQCSSLENSMNRGAWRATVHGVKIIPKPIRVGSSLWGSPPRGAPPPAPGTESRPLSLHRCWAHFAGWGAGTASTTGSSGHRSPLSPGAHGLPPARAGLRTCEPPPSGALGWPSRRACWAHPEQQGSRAGGPPGRCSQDGSQTPVPAARPGSRTGQGLGRADVLPSRLKAPGPCTSVAGASRGQGQGGQPLHHR